MKIYVGHPSSIDFREELYEPIRESRLYEEHNIVLPHENSDELFDSKNFLRTECDLFVAEVSEASTGLGIELGWADEFEVPILCIHRQGSDPSTALEKVADDIRGYSDSREMVELIEENLRNK